MKLKFKSLAMADRISEFRNTVAFRILGVRAKGLYGF